jgi:tetratricopeptide (TPR) repeat protein
MTEQLIEEGLECLQAGDLPAAIERFDAVLKNDRLPEVLYYRGVAHDMSGEPEKALADLNLCLDLDPLNPRGLFSRSVVHRSQQNWSLALADVSRAHELDPKDYRCANAYAQLLLHTPMESERDLARAEEIALEACKQTDFQDPNCLTTFLQTLEASGQTEKANQVREMLEQSDAQEIAFPELAQEVLEFFSDVMGEDPEPNSMQEIVPALSEGVSVCTIAAPEDCPFHLLFTVGMSQQAMNVPAGMGAAQYGYAEACLRIPASWSTEPDLEAKEQSWPWMWLKILAIQTHLEGLCVTTGPSLFPPGDKIEPRWQGSEYRLAEKDGFDALFKRFQAQEVPLHFEPDRASAV